MMLRRVFLAFLIFGLVACGDDGTGPEDIAGTYTLQTVDGEELPALLPLPIEATGTLEITAGSVTLNQDMTCSISLSLRASEDGTVTTGTETDGCTYTFTDSQAEFAITVTFLAHSVSGSIFASIWDVGNVVNGVVAGSTLTLIDPRNVFIFRK